jgi:hypothetical protein
MRDLVAMLMTFLRLKNSSSTQILPPSGNMLGFTQSTKGRYAFRKCLEAYCKSHEVGDQMKAILQTCQTLSVSFREWDLSEIVGPIIDYLDALHTAWDQFMPWVVDHFPLGTKRLLSVHIRFRIFRENGETSISASQNPDYDFQVNGYFTELPKMLDALYSSHEPQEWDSDNPVPVTAEAIKKHYVDAWFTFLFGPGCWGACHDFVPGERAPSEWWESQLPIYIG